MDNFFFQNNNSNNYSRTYSKGKSFKFSVWNPDDVYNNDEYIQDFVEFNNSLWACAGNNIISEEPNELSGNWNLITKGLSNADILQVIEDLGIMESNPFEKGNGNSAVLKNLTKNEATYNGAFAIGGGTVAKSSNAEAGGFKTVAAGAQSRATGYKTIANNENEFACGKYNKSNEDTLFSIGVGTSESSRKNAFEVKQNGDIYIEGVSVKIQERLDIFERGETENNAILKGGDNIATANYSTAFGLEAKAKGEAAHAEGYQTKAYGGTSHAEGYQTGAGGGSSHAEGQGTEATGLASHAEGYLTDAKADYAHSEGQETQALGYAAHAEGYKTQAAKYAHSEGNSTIASGESSHAEGVSTNAIGAVSHAEGRKTTANGEYSHTEGRETEANGKYSHAEGFTTITYNEAEHACGRYNNSVEKTESNTDADATLFSIGIGTSKKERRNSFEVKQNGDVYVNGIGNYDGSNSESAKSLKDVVISWTIL